MELLFELHPALAALIIFGLRIVDVSLGTIRTISLVNGRIAMAVALGFFEVLVWIAAISQVIVGVKDNPLWLVAYAAGFAAGNGVGIVLERQLAIGIQILNVFSARRGDELAEALRTMGQAVTQFHGEGRDGPVQQLYVTCPRRATPLLIERIREIEPEVFYVVESVTTSSRRLNAPLHAGGWRAGTRKT